MKRENQKQDDRKAILNATAKAHTEALATFRLIEAAYPVGSDEFKAAFDARHRLLDLFDLLNGRPIHD